MKRDCARRGVFCLMLLWAGMFWPVIAGADQTGGTPVDWDELAKLPQWQPQPMGEAETFAVDLRSKLPPVGTQKMNDCASWAVGYAAKSYLEAIDQGWTPNTSARIFSPRFLYNQLNGGKDAGSNIIKAVKLIQEKGCATLATCPYVPGDFIGQPDAKAFAEAKNYVAAGVYLVADGAGIRTALSQGNVVLLAVKTNPIFNGGRYEVYDMELHRQGRAQRKPGQQHGFHALTIVGFDDTRSAFLIMNSWGSAWAKNGFCWVSYDVLAKFNTKLEENDQLGDYAAVMVDRRARVEVGPDGVATGLAKPAREMIVARGNADYRGYDSKLKKHAWFFTASLNGDDAAIDLVSKVTWRYTADNKAQTLVAADRQQAFKAFGTQYEASFDVTGEIAFKDGTSRSVTAEFRLPPPSADNREVRIAFNHWYHGPNSDGEAMWDWQAGLDGNLNDLKDINKVEWNAGRMTRVQPVATFTRQNNTPPSHAKMLGIATKTNQITAAVHFDDGSIKTLSIDPIFTDPVDEEIAIKHRFTEEQTPDGKAFYTYIAWLKFPHRYFYMGIDRVDWNLGPKFGNREIATNWSTRNFEIQGSSDREFRLTATIKFRDGSTKVLDEWIELGNDGKYADPRRVEIEKTDKYMGVEDGQPTWWITARPMGDPRTLEKIARVEYKYPESFKHEPAVREAGDFSLVAAAVGYSYDMTATVHYKDGNFTRFPVRIESTVPRDDFVRPGIEFTRRNGNAKVESGAWTMGIAGPEFERKRIAKAELTYVSAAGIRRRSILEPSSREWPALLQHRGEFAEPFDLETILTTNDGWRCRFVTPVTLEDSAPVAPAYTVQLWEKFYGVEDGRPTWIVRAKLAGTPEELAKVKAVAFVRWSDKENFKAGKAPFEAEIKVTSPESIVAHVELADGKEVIVGGATTALGDRTDTPVVLKQATLGTSTAQQIDWVVYVDGWESALRRVKQVTYKMPPAMGSEQRTLNVRNYGAHSGFPLKLSSTEPTTIDAVVTMEDGSTKELSVQTGLPLPKLDWSTRDVYWGLDATGKPSWLVTFRMNGPTEKLLSFTTVGYHRTRESILFFRGLNTADSSTCWPAFETEAFLTGPGVFESVSLLENAAKWETLPGRTVTPRAARLDELVVRQVRGMSWDGQTDAQKEWVNYLAGPEQMLEQVKSVEWTIGEAPAVTVAYRWGEKFAGFETRTYSPSAVKARATVTFNDGKRVTVDSR